MGKPLQKRLFTVLFFLTVFSFFFSATGVFAQVAIDRESGLEISFSQSTSLSQSGFIQLTPEDLSGSFVDDPQGSIRPWDESRPQGSPFYVNSENGEFGIGGLKPAFSSINRLFHLSVVNRLQGEVEGFQIVFDLLYLENFEEEYSLQLRYSVNGDQWMDVSGARINRNMLNRNGNGWNTFSIQTTLDDIYLNSNESIQFEWVDLTGNIPADKIPVAIQNMEFVPEMFSPTQISRGDIVISEILPSTETQGGSIEFIELYNPTDKTIDLKGVVIQTPSGSQTIRKRTAIAPHQFITLFTGPLSNNSEITESYRYSSSILSNNRGYVELYLDDEELAKATYERSDLSGSLELNTISNGYDGYTSLQNFQASSGRLNGELSASPGRAGSTQKMYVTELNGDGWHLINAPGQLDERLSRLNARDIRSIDANETNTQSGAEPGKPFLFRIENGETKKLFSNESAQDQVFESYPLSGVAAKLISSGSESITTLGNLADDRGSRIAPAVLVWSAEAQKFELLFDDETEISAWTPFVVHNETNQPAAESTAQSNSLRGNGLTRFIEFELFEKTRGSQLNPIDAALLGFMIREQESDDRRFDLPKLLPIIAEDEEPEETELSLAYFTNPESENRASSFTHLPLEPDQPHSINFGIISFNRAYQAVLDWSHMQDIPDEWKMTLKDNYTDREIDMQEQTSYEFRMNASEATPNAENQQPGEITPYEPEEEERFTITVQPFGESVTANNESERPGNVELRQNYPNPFNPSTNVVFYLPEQQPVKVGVYNIVGQQVAQLADEVYGPGEHTISWNASEMPSGVYIVQLEVGSRIFTRKITLIK